MSAFQGISTMSTALQAFQRQLDVTGHNISNVNTAGYTRQRVDLLTMDPTNFQGANGKLLSIGNGVTVGSVESIRDLFLQGRRMAANSDLARSNAQSSGMDGVQSVVLGPGQNGISDALDSFWNAWSGLAANPGDAGSKSQVQMAGQDLTDKVRGTYQSLSGLSAATTGQINQTLTDIQTDATNIAALNDQIRQATASGGTPNDLMDRRDIAVQDLASKVDINVSHMTDGTYSIQIDQLTIVDSSGAHPVPTSWNAATSSLTNGTVTSTVRGGSLAGLLDTANKIAGYQANLDTLANTLRTQVNSLMGTGVNAAGATGLKFFNDVTPPAAQTGAANFDLDNTGVVGPPSSPGVKSSAAAIPTGTSGAASDGSIALGLSQMRSQAMAGLGNSTFGNYFNNLLGQIGRDGQIASSAQTTNGAVLTQIDQQVQSISGVSLDDEMANMLRFQRSYQAAAKTLTTMDQVTQTLIDMLQR